MAKTLTAALIIILAGCILLIAGTVFAWHQLHQDLGHRYAEDTGRYPLPETPYTNVRLRARDGIDLAGWLIPADNPRGGVVLVHGFDPRGGKAEMLPHARYLHDAGYSTLLIDLRGVGDSGGDRISLGTREWQDAEAAYDLLARQPELKGKSVGFLGESMGGSTSIIAAGKTGKGDFVIADVPFASYPKLFAAQAAENGFGWIPVVGALLRTAALFELGMDYTTYNPEDLIGNINAPIFIIWSDNDERIGLDQGSRLYTLANPPKTQWQTRYGHDITDHHLEEFKDHTLRFLSSLPSR